MLFPFLTKSNAIKPIGWSPEKQARSARYTRLCLLFLLIALLILALSGCSKAVSVAPMSQPPANLASNCPQLPLPPHNMTDPDRIVWEMQIVAQYGDCALRHRKTVEAWREALRSK